MNSKIILVPFLIITFLIALRFVSAEKSNGETNHPTLSFEVDEHILVRHPSRMGINLGSLSSLGNLSLSGDILMNPGFEGRISRRLIIVSQNDESSFSDEAGLGDPDHYWDEAEFDVRTGASAGKTGVIKRSVNSGANGLPQYFPKSPLPNLSPQDIIVLTKLSRPTPPDFWTFNDQRVVTTDPYQKRPESQGTQSIRLTPVFNQIAAVEQILDAAAESTGKLIPINGSWIFSFWAKGQNPGATIQVIFQRENGSDPFIDKTLFLETQWKKYDLPFTGKDSGGDRPLKLTLSSSHENGSIWVDEPRLRMEINESRPFSMAAAEALKIFKPSFLRSPAPLGDTFENLAAVPNERRTWSHLQLGSSLQPVYNYSIGEFLELCREIKANPWLVVPSVFSDFECLELARFLTENANKAKFAEVIVEFGYENWNWLYRAFEIPYPALNGILANRMFAILSKEVQGKVNLRKLVNGQYSIPSQAIAFLDHTSQADGLAISPNFLETLDKGTPDKEVFEMLFKDESGELRELSDHLYSSGKSLVVNEVNLHTIKGTAKSYERNRVVSGMVAGSALAKRLLECLFSGANPIMVYDFGQQEIPSWESNEFVKLPGIVRAFGPPLVLRPTGIAVYMLNQIIGGNLHAIKPIGDQVPERESLTLTAFKTPETWTAAVASSNSSPLNITMLFPSDRHPLPTQAIVMTTDGPFENNETEENVRAVASPVDHQGRAITFTIPPRGFVVLK